MPAAKKKSKKVAAKGRSASKESRRFWLLYPTKRITEPIIWQLSHKFPLVTNIRQASVTDELGIVCLELQGSREDIKSAIKWLERTGIKVEPVEINVIES